MTIPITILLLLLLIIIITIMIMTNGLLRPLCFTLLSSQVGRTRAKHTTGTLKEFKPSTQTSLSPKGGSEMGDRPNSHSKSRLRHLKVSVFLDLTKETYI